MEILKGLYKIMEKINFEEFEQKIKECNAQQFLNLVKEFDELWNKNLFENEFNYKYGHEKFYDVVAERIVNFKVYPDKLHNILVKNLNAKQVVFIAKSIELSQEKINDFQEKTIADKDVEGSIIFSQIKGADIDKLQKRVLQSVEYEDYVKFVKNVPNANVGLFKNRLYEAFKRTQSLKKQLKIKKVFNEISKYDNAQSMSK